MMLTTSPSVKVINSPALSGIFLLLLFLLGLQIGRSPNPRADAARQRGARRARLEAQQPVVHEHAVQARADDLVHQRRGDRAVHAAAQRADHVLLRPDLSNVCPC